MMNVIIGHRGTGKTQWLDTIKSLYKESNKPVHCYDLDRQIEKQTNQSIYDLFSQGESVFRKLEKEVFEKLLNKNRNIKEDVYISVGAGFQFSKESNWNIIHLQRPTDSQGRIFFNRPLLSNKTPFEDYQSVYAQRDDFYRSASDECFSRLEHFKEKQLSDKVFLNLKKLEKEIFSLRIDPRENLKRYLDKRLDWGVRYFEINDEEASLDFIKQVKECIPNDKILFSSQHSKLFCDIPNKIHWSWDLDLGEPPKGVTILSLHRRYKKSLSEILKQFSQYQDYHLKLAVEIFDFKELKQAYEWQQQDSKNRSFLPRSKEGRWRWFRSAFGSEMHLYFIREGFSSVLDQPFFSEAIHYLGRQKKLSAVVGYPIEFSATPYEQNAFFKKKNMLTLFISLKEEEFNKKTLDILTSLGFVFFAVTSPLKKQAYLIADSCDEKTKALKSSNTLILNDDKWMAFNTDVEGLKVLKQKVNDRAIAVWGGGGVKSSLQSIFPKAVFYSARTGKVVFGVKNSQPEILIWAVGRNRMKDCLWPPKDWTFKEVIDLNYGEDSPGKEYALKNKISYTSGEIFFKEQAAKQRELFSELEQR